MRTRSPIRAAAAGLTVLLALVALLALPGSARAASRGTMVLLHGGSWAAAGPGAVASTDAAARRFRKAGWRTVQPDFAAGGEAGLDSVLGFVDEELRRGGPVCLYGESSGGHLALMGAVRRREVDCVITAGAPTDLILLGPGADLNTIVTRTFNLVQRVTFNPWLHADAIKADMLLGHAAADTVVSPLHALRMDQRRADISELVLLERGDRGWIHATTSADAQKRWWQRVRALLNREAGA